MSEKLTELDEISTPSLDDLLYLVDDPAGVPASYKISANRFLGGLLPNINQFRLTLATGRPVYRPNPLTPSSTDTTLETVTFSAAHNWLTGTIVTVGATANGLTLGTRYYIRAVSATAVSFHSSVATAEAGTSPVNLSGNITAVITPSGISTTTIYLAQYNGSLISIFDGTRWKLYSNAEISLALGTLTSDANYDVFIYDNSGTLTLELTAWTSSTVRATELTTQDGILVKTGATTRRYLGTLRTDSTTTTIKDGGGIASQVGGKCFLWNYYNQIPFEMFVFDGTSNYAYSTATVRQANAPATGDKNELVVGIVDHRIYAKVSAQHQTAAIGVVGSVQVGINSTSAYVQRQTRGWAGGADANSFNQLVAEYNGPIPLGYNEIIWLESGNGSATCTWHPSPDGVHGLRQSGMITVVDA